MTEPSDRDPLVRLGALCGIAPDYYDIWGNRRVTSEQTLRALLAAMGVRADSTADARTALDEIEIRGWRRTLPPVKVVREQETPCNITVTISSDRRDEVLPWRLIGEKGEYIEGSVKPSDLAVIEQRELGGETLVRCCFPLSSLPGAGYHRFELDGAAMSLIIAPARCFQPRVLEGNGRVWGPALQLYGLRSERNWGIGDYGDLRGVVEFCAEQGADVIGVNPLHALFPDNPEHAVPYGPSSRLFLNILYLDVEEVADFAECEEARGETGSPPFQARLKALRAEDLVRYTGVAAAKFPVLDLLFQHFRKHHLDQGSERGRMFRAYQAEQGLALRRHALFEALQAHFRAQDPFVWGWTSWPGPYRDPASPEVAAFCEENLERVEFYEYLQWQAELQLHAAGRRSFELGLGVGLLLDLAVGVSRGGSETWSDQSLYAMNASIGAPPDDFNLHGQDWGLPPLIPYRLTEHAYAPFIATLRESMGPAGALRIDHVMGLMRQFWVPAGGSAADGAYVNYPFDDLLGILALESSRNQCLVVGEDLGTVPDSFREAMKANGVLSYRLLYFERDGAGEFKSPVAFPDHALAVVTTHDLATLAGYCRGVDLDVRSRLGLFPTEEQRKAQAASRIQDCARLTTALEREQLLSHDGARNGEELTPEYIQAVHAYLARSPAKLMLVQLEDIFGQLEQVNLPGTTEEKYPNWRRKLPLDLEKWRDDPRVTGMAGALRRERGAVAGRFQDVA